MPLPQPAWLSLAETVWFAVAATGESEDRVRSALTEAALAGTIAATGCRHRSAHPNPDRYFAHPLLYDREVVPSSAWGTAISWPQSRVGIYDLVRFHRAEIERWLGTVPAAAVSPDELPTTDAVAATGDQTSPSTVSYNELKAAIELHGNAAERTLIKHAKAAFPQKRVPRSLVRRARGELFDKPLLGRPKGSK
jgi:hypothetical protein